MRLVAKSLKGARDASRERCRPAPTITFQGLLAVARSESYLDLGDISGGERLSAYRPASMSDVAGVPFNGLSVVSTFSGCGGSCLGYRMAGYRVVWANEFVPNAQECYRLNHSETALDPRDVREVQPGDVLASLALKEGELDLLDGSPPCQAFSMAGRRERGWGSEKRYEGGHRQRNEDMFPEFERLLRGLMPRAFVAENVAGLVRGTAKGYFMNILAGLRGSGYRVDARLLDAQWLGVPQTRERVFFVGVRADLERDPVFPSPWRRRYSVLDACPWLSRRPPSPSDDDLSGPVDDLDIEPPTYRDGRRRFTILEIKRICGFPDDFRLVGSYAQRWERLGNSVPPPMAAAVGRSLLPLLQSDQ